MSIAGLVATTATVVIFGRLADLTGARRIYSLGLCVFAAGAAISALAPGVGALAAALAAQGIGWSMVVSSATPLLVQAFPPEKRGRVVAASHMAVAIGLAVGPGAGGLVVEHLGWRVALLTVAPVALGVGALVHTKLPSDQASRPRPHVDLAGSASLVVALGVLLVLVDRTGHGGLAGTLLLYGVGAGLFQSPNISGVLGAATAGRLGVASGTLSTLGRLGQVVGVAVAGGIWEQASVAMPFEAPPHLRPTGLRQD